MLAVIALPDGFAINVRAGRNLLRPSHFFVHSKQADLDTLLFSDQAFGFGTLSTDMTLYEGAQLVNGANPTATVAQPTFLFNTTDHILYFDQDGIGSGAAIAVVQLSQTTHLDYLMLG